MRPGAHPLLWLAACIVLAFMILPSVIVMGMSFSGGRFLEFPPSTVSMRWYSAYWSDPAWLAATVRSLQVAVLVTVLAVTTGTMASLALVRFARPGIASASIFAFLTSFDEIVIAMFIAGGTPTLPKLMFDGIQFELNPVVAAVSTQLIVVSASGLLCAMWLRRRVEGLGEKRVTATASREASPLPVVQ